jgi:hypothetical protein
LAFACARPWLASPPARAPGTPIRLGRFTEWIKNTAELVDLTGFAEYQALATRFSSGVTIHELASVAEVLSCLAGVAAPCRSEKRNFRQLICWFRAHWASVTPYLCAIQLRDSEGTVIDAGRESTERGRPAFPLIS